jgi:hypothetical protein
MRFGRTQKALEWRRAHKRKTNNCRRHHIRMAVIPLQLRDEGMANNCEEGIWYLPNPDMKVHCLHSDGKEAVQITTQSSSSKPSNSQSGWWQANGTYENKVCSNQIKPGQLRGRNEVKEKRNYTDISSALSLSCSRDCSAFRSPDHPICCKRYASSNGKQSKAIPVTGRGGL